MAAPPTPLGAIVVAFDASGITLATAGGLWTELIPEQLPDHLPMAVLVHDGEIPRYTSETGYMEVTRFHFEVYSTLANAEAIALQIKGVFDKPGTSDAMQAFQVFGAKVLQCWRPDGQNCYRVEPMVDRTSNGDPVFKVSIHYEMTLSRSL
jgi:hypothetical protein